METGNNVSIIKDVVSILRIAFMQDFKRKCIGILYNIAHEKDMMDIFS